MTKVVYNTCFGGFSVSKEAIDWLNARGMNINSPYHDFLRHDPLLVECVETLGNRANGACAILNIAEIDGPYRIDEYDGRESVETPTSYDWITP